jgi:hypothetical protein
MAPGDLRRDELIELVEAITRGSAATEEEDDRLVQLFEVSVVHPAAGRWVSACSNERRRRPVLKMTELRILGR